MTQKKDTQNEKLIQELYEKLWWYTHEASEEEFNEKEVDAIVQLLDVLEPIKEDHVFEPGAEAAFGRFKERFGLEEEFAEVEADMVEAAGTGDEGSEAEAATEIELENVENEVSSSSVRKIRRKPDWKKIGIRVGIGIAACLVLMVSLELGTYALRKQSFFEVIRLGDRKTEYIATGNVEEVEIEGETYSEWDALEKDIGNETLEPTFIPDHMNLIYLALNKEINKQIVRAEYNSDSEYLYIYIYLFEDDYEKRMSKIEAKWEQKECIENGSVYSYEEDWLVDLIKGEKKYTIYTNLSLEVLKNIINGL